jgi:DNA repair exonuclease SbcCD ATPase subunit
MPAFKAMSQPVDHAGKRNVKLKNELNKKKEELEQEKKKLEEATNRLLDSERTSQSLNEELEQEKKKSEETTNRLLDTEKNLTECISKIEKMTVSAESLQQEKRILEKTNRSFKTRVEELLKEQQIYKKAELLNKAKLQEQSYQLDQLQTELSTAKKDISSMRNKLSGKKWLQRTSEILAINAGSTWENKLLSLLPARFFRDIQMKRLKREGLFDASAYLAAYPDVKKAGVEPLYHYIHHGMQERRTPTKSAKN